MPEPERGDLPSINLVLDVLRAGRTERRDHFEALDQKAGSPSASQAFSSR